MNPYYKIYLEQVCRLAATMTIKSVYAANKMNEKVSILGRHVNYDDRKTWKYYMNLNGDYHPTDVTMTVTSMDTYEEIEFTKEFLSRHVLTKRTYVYGNKFYNDLVSRYPSQETLIRGILSPIPYTDSIPADDHTILNYPKALVEGNEQYLMPELQSHVLGCYDRWLNIDYTRVEPRYMEAFNTLVYTNLVQWILLARRRKRFTDQVHSYHLRMYLLSFSGIGVEFDYMSHPQRLWFYRNIRYLNRNVGRQAIFDQLVEKVLNDRTFPLVRYELALDYEDLIRDTLPTPLAIKKQEGRLASIYGSDRNTLDGSIDKQLPLAKDNHIFRDVAVEDVYHKMVNNRFGSMKTKMLESTIVDRTDAEPFTLSNVMMSHWVHMSQIGLYKAMVPFNNPDTGEAYILDTMDAYIFYVYAVTRYYGTTLVELPCVYIDRVMREIPPTVDELLSVTDPSLDLLPFIDYVLSKAVELQRVESVITFRELCVNIHSMSNELRDMRHFQGDYILEGNLHTIVDRLFHGRNVQLGEGVFYEEWLMERDINPDSLRDSDLLDMASDIVSKVTGVSATAGSAMKETHAAMLRMMGVLTSYSVQFVAQVNDSAIKILDGKFPKLTIPVVDGQTEVHTRLENPMILKTSVNGGSTVPIDIVLGTLDNVAVTGHVIHPVNTGVFMDATTSTLSRVPLGLQIPTFRIKRHDPVDMSTLDNSGVLTIDYTLDNSLPWRYNSLNMRYNKPHLSNYTHFTLNRLKLLMDV